MANIKEMAELAHRRSMTKKALKAERNATRKTWDGIRPSAISTQKDKIRRSDRQITKAQLKAYCV